MPSGVATVSTAMPVALPAMATAKAPSRLAGTPLAVPMSKRSSAAFAATLPAPLPPHVRAVHAPLGMVLGRVAGNGDAQVTVRFTTPVPQGAIYYKYGPSPDGLGCTGAACAQPHWYALPGAQFAPDGMSVTFTLTDGGVGDSDSVPHQITDPGLPALLAPPAPPAPQAIPALGPWALALLSLLAAGLGAMRRRALL